jgi:ribosomal protein S18 acetylase RimI-like enzyme
LTNSAALRAISWRDWRRLAKLSLEAFPDATPAQVSRTLRDVSNIVVLDIDGKAIGYGAFRHEKQGVLWCDWIAVDPEYRGHGYGALLIDAIESIAVKRGYTAVMLAVLKTNHGAFRFYCSHGYETSDENDRKYHLIKYILQPADEAPDIPRRSLPRHARLWHRIVYRLIV